MRQNYYNAVQKHITHSRAWAALHLTSVAAGLVILAFISFAGFSPGTLRQDPVPPPPVALLEEQSYPNMKEFSNALLAILMFADMEKQIALIK